MSGVLHAIVDVALFVFIAAYFTNLYLGRRERKRRAAYIAKRAGGYADAIVGAAVPHVDNAVAFPNLHRLEEIMRLAAQAADAERGRILLDVKRGLIR